MAIKYFCPKCHKRFVEWGAKKTAFKCPNDTCKGEELKLMDSAVLIESTDKPKLKRVKAKKRLPVPIGDVFDEDDGIIDVPMEDEEFEDVEQEEGEIEEVEDVEDVIEGVDEFGAAGEIIEGVVDVDIIDEPLGEPLDAFEPEDMPIDEEII